MICGDNNGLYMGRSENRIRIYKLLGDFFISRFYLRTENAIGTYYSWTNENSGLKSGIGRNDETVTKREEIVNFSHTINIIILDQCDGMQYFSLVFLNMLLS